MLQNHESHETNICSLRVSFLALSLGLKTIDSEGCTYLQRSQSLEEIVKTKSINPLLYLWSPTLHHHHATRHNG